MQGKGFNVLAQRNRLEAPRLPRLICNLVLFCAAAVIAAPAQSIFFTTLASFNGTDGSYPASLVQASDGNFYGTTVNGGAYRYGTAFKITPGGVLTTLYSFCSQPNCADGSGPFAALVQATDGNFYGTTYGGGTYSSGTAFKITPGGTLTTQYSFCSQPNCADGAGPFAALVQATDGSFYGTTYQGGTNDGGTVFKITPSGTLTTLHSFDGSDGLYPDTPLTQGSDGTFYGTTQQGGAGSAGTVFKITPSGNLTTLHSFDGSDGLYPNTPLTQGSDGNFYGAAEQGGAYRSGTVFKITPAGTLTVLHSFDGSDGYIPLAVLVQASDGNFYGLTDLGGTYSSGTVFKITPGGTLTTLYSFCSQSGCIDGANPDGGLVLGRDSNFYGTTSEGGAFGDGTVFRLDVVPPCAICGP
jgi:uncharacterized repeat protein (TIGR03803 family)